MCEYAGTVWCTREIVVLLLAAGLVCGVVACGAAAAQAGVRARATSANGVAAVRTREVERDFRLITVPPVTGSFPMSAPMVERVHPLRQECWAAGVRRVAESRLVVEGGSPAGRGRVAAGGAGRVTPPRR